MSVRILSAFFGVAGLLAGCGTVVTEPLTQDELVTSGFAVVSPTGAIDLGLDQVDVNKIIRFGQNGYAYQVGFDNTDGLFAVSGLLPTTSVTPTPTGTAIYQGNYQIAIVDNITLDAPGRPGIWGDPTIQKGPLTLLADFSDGSVQTPLGSALTVNGNVDDDLGGLNGNVQYGGVTGDLDMLIGGDQAIGAFHGEGNVGPGTDDDYMYAGGFIADR